MSFKNAIVVMTSNAGSGADVKNGLGFVTQTGHERVGLALRQVFSPEFLGRLDAVACFSRLGLPELTQIARSELDRLVTRAAGLGASLTVSPDAAETVAEKALLDPAGARAIRHLLQEQAVSPLSEFVLSHDAPGKLRLFVREGELELAPLTES